MAHTKTRRAGRSTVLTAAIGLALAAGLASPAWANTDTSPGLNGTSGRPANGSVGKADFKTPPGQALTGEDADAGYECDRNKGVGQGNPAHTGCTDQGSD